MVARSLQAPGMSGKRSVASAARARASSVFPESRDWAASVDQVSHKSGRASQISRSWARIPAVQEWGRPPPGRCGACSHREPDGSSRSGRSRAPPALTACHAAVGRVPQRPIRSSHRAGSLREGGIRPRFDSTCRGKQTRRFPGWAVRQVRARGIPGLPQALRRDARPDSGAWPVPAAPRSRPGESRSAHVRPR